jgi:UDP-2-acetamido-3-amino-2,3-dideoxy-glucuronate N-acetyltransferase
VCPGAILGADVVIGAFVFVADGAVVGAGTRVQSHVSIWTGVTLGEDVFVGPSVTFTNVRHPRAAFPRAPNFDRTTVADGATLGAASVLVAPLHVGACALVGAGAVVTRDVPPHAIVAGNPARLLGWACTCGETIARGARRPKHAHCTLCDRDFTPDPASAGLTAAAPKLARAPAPSRAAGARGARRSRRA